MAAPLRVTVVGREGEQPREFTIVRAFNLGFTIRDQARMQAHLDEVAKEGVPPPRVGVPPIVFPLSPWAVTTASEVPVQYARTSGEVEIVTLVDGDGSLYVSVGSDHTDRDLEAIDIPWSKQVCPSVVAPVFWHWPAVADVWDETEIASWVGDQPDHLVPYQRARVSEFLSPPEMVAALARKIRRPEGAYLFLSGTVVSLGEELAYREYFAMRLHNPVRGWTIEHRYRAPVLFAEIDLSDMTFARRGTLPAGTSAGSAGQRPA
jgi:hypothetical protein